MAPQVRHTQPGLGSLPPSAPTAAHPSTLQGHGAVSPSPEAVTSPPLSPHRGPLPGMSSAHLLPPSSPHHLWEALQDAPAPSQSLLHTYNIPCRAPWSFLGFVIILLVSTKTPSQGPPPGTADPASGSLSAGAWWLVAAPHCACHEGSSAPGSGWVLCTPQVTTSTRGSAPSTPPASPRSQGGPAAGDTHLARGGHREVEAVG